MKPNENEMICDDCKIMIAKNKCMVCGKDICKNCGMILFLKIECADEHEFEGSTVISDVASYLGNKGKRYRAVISNHICKSCRDSFQNKDVIEQITTLPELITAIDTVKKVIFRGKVAEGLEDKKKEEDNKLPHITLIPTVFSSSTSLYTHTPNNLVNPIIKTATNPKSINTKWYKDYTKNKRNFLYPKRKTKI